MGYLEKVRPQFLSLHRYILKPAVFKDVKTRKSRCCREGLRSGE